MFQLVIIKTVSLIPQASATNSIYRVGNTDEMLEKLRGHLFVSWIRLRKFERHRKHREAVETHPRCPVSLLKKSTGRQRLGTIEDANVIESEKATGEKIIAFRVLPIHPPGKV